MIKMLIDNKTYVIWYLKLFESVYKRRFLLLAVKFMAIASWAKWRNMIASRSTYDAAPKLPNELRIEVVLKSGMLSRAVDVKES